MTARLSVITGDELAQNVICEVYQSYQNQVYSQVVTQLYRDGDIFMQAEYVLLSEHDSEKQLSCILTSLII